MMEMVGIAHILIAVVLIGLVLLQDSKGGAMGVFGGGGGSSTIFGSSGGANFLVKLTSWVAIGFAATSISLAILSTKGQTSAVDKDIATLESLQDAPKEEAKTETPADAETKKTEETK